MINKVSVWEVSYNDNIPKDLSRKLLIEITENDIDVAFWNKETLQSIKLNWFHTRGYDIPQELLTLFNIKYEEHKSKKIFEIRKKMNKFLFEQKDWKDQLKVWSELEPLWAMIVWLSWKQNIDNVIENYIYDRIFYKVLRQSWTSSKDQARIKTLTTGEKLKKFTPELKMIIDNIINDIHKNFKIQIKRKDQDPFREGKYIEPNNNNKLQVVEDDLRKKLWIHNLEDQYDLANMPHTMEEDENWKDQKIHKDSIYKIISRKRKINKTTNKSSKVR